MLTFESKKRYGLEDLREIVSRLRSPDGCPWDIEQTHESIRRNLIEEAYEAAEAIDEHNPEHLCEELGDLLLQVVFHADIESDTGTFNLDDVADSVCRKLIYRHPHVFKNSENITAGEVVSNWEKLKQIEKNHETVTDTLKSVARSLPSLWRAEKIAKKAAKTGFDFKDVNAALDSLKAEIEELQDALKNNENVQDELGDVLFSVANAARLAGIDPESALHSTSDKFIRRFEAVEQYAITQGKSLTQLSPLQIDEIYNLIKTDLEN